MLVAVVCTRHESACCRDHAPALIVVSNGAAMKLRLMEQSYSCPRISRCEAERDSRMVLARLCLKCRVLVAPTRRLQCVLAQGIAGSASALEARATAVQSDELNIAGTKVEDEGCGALAAALQSGNLRHMSRSTCCMTRAFITWSMQNASGAAQHGSSCSRLTSSLTWLSRKRSATRTAG